MEKKEALNIQTPYSPQHLQFYTELPHQQQKKKLVLPEITYLSTSYF